MEQFLCHLRSIVGFVVYCNFITFHCLFKIFTSLNQVSSFAYETTGSFLWGNSSCKCVIYLESRQIHHSGCVKAMTGKIAFHKNYTESEETKIACLRVMCCYIEKTVPPREGSLILVNTVPAFKHRLQDKIKKSNFIFIYSCLF